MTRRLLLAGSGSGSFTIPPAEGWQTLVTPENAGAFLGQNYPNAVYYNGVTYFGYNNGDNGNIEVRTYTHASGVTSAATVIDSGLEIETHDPPSLLMRSSDHKLIVFFMKHSASVAYMRVASSAESIASFAGRVSLHTSIGATDYTYPSAHELTAEGAIYLFYRDDNTTGVDGTRASLSYTKSTDNGATWSAKTKIHAPTTERPYWMVRGNGVDRIDFFVSEDDRAFHDNVPGYHFYLTGGSYYTTDGTLIGSFPLTIADMTEVYAGTAGSTDPMDIAWDESGNPLVTWRLWKPTAPTGGTAAYFARWTGSAWTTTLVQDGGDEIYITATDPRIVLYARRLVGSVYHIYRYTSTDNGATFTAQAIYTATTDDLTYLTPVKDGVSPLKVLWSEGTYVSATNFDFGVRGGF